MQVRSAVVLRKNRRGKSASMGCGVVEFETPSAAQNAVMLLNDTELDGRIIKCREDRVIEGTTGDEQLEEEEIRQPAFPVPPEVPTLQQAQQVGESEPAAGRPRRNRRSRGSRSDSQPVASSQVDSTPPVPPAAKVIEEGQRVRDPCKVFVTSLAWETTQEDLLKYFSVVGRVISAEV